jgi:4-amino-4-deoxychorismate lyase
MSDHLKLSDYISVPDHNKNGIVRCRVTYGVTFSSIEFLPYTPAKVFTLKLVQAEALVYDHKYLDRSPLNCLIDKSIADDILVIQNGCVTDASYANIVFTDGRQWITPDTPLLCGTIRELLLRGGIIKAEKILANDIHRFTHFRLINAMLGFEAPVLPVSNII